MIEICNKPYSLLNILLRYFGVKEQLTSVPDSVSSLNWMITLTWHNASNRSNHNGAQLRHVISLMMILNRKGDL